MPEEVHLRVCTHWDLLPSNTAHASTRGKVLALHQPFLGKLHAHPPRQAQFGKRLLVERSSPFPSESPAAPACADLHCKPCTLATSCISPSYTWFLLVPALLLTLFPLGQGSGNFLCKGPDTKHFRLCGCRVSVPTQLYHHEHESGHRNR